MLGVPIHGGPTEEGLIVSARRWHEIILRSQNNVWIDGDGDRLRIGFDLLEAQVEFWPPVSRLIKLMPPRKALTCLPEVVVTNEVDPAVLAEIRGVVASLGVVPEDMTEAGRCERLRLLNRQRDLLLRDA